MTATLDDDKSSIIIGSGDSQIAISLKHLKSGRSQSTATSSILIDVDGLEIEVRRSQRRASFRLPSISIRCESANESLKEEQAAKSSRMQWDYSNAYGPYKWSTIFPQLRWKKFQSPIRIYTDLCEYEPVLARRPFIFETSETCCQTLENSGHSFLVSGQGYSYITGGPVIDDYEFLQFHMHWGAHDNEGSEHVIDSIRLPAELHIVTWNITRFKTPEEAIASERFGGLLVFAILIKIVPNNNPSVDKLFDLLSKITNKGDKINLDSGVISLQDLMPENIQDYYTYDGSLTTPMCYESVRWIVFRERMGLSKHQLNQLRQLKHTCKNDKTPNGFITKNFRPLMPLNGRTIYRSFA